MTKRATILGLVGEQQPDGSFHIHCPEVPLFHIVGETQETALATALPILRETLERRLNRSVELIIPEDLQAIVENAEAVESPAQMPLLPVHVIAEVSQQIA